MTTPNIISELRTSKTRKTYAISVDTGKTGSLGLNSDKPPMTWSIMDHYNVDIVEVNGEFYAEFGQPVPAIVLREAARLIEEEERCDYAQERGEVVAFFAKNNRSFGTTLGQVNSVEEWDKLVDKDREKK